MEGKNLGTTTLGICGDDFIVLGADKRATTGYLIASKEEIKIYSLNKYIGITTAGSVGDAQKIVRVMRAELKLMELDNERISVKGAATLLSNILHASKWFPFLNQFVVGGIDESGPKLYDLDPVGGLVEHKDYTSTGSGSPIALGVLEDSFKEKMKIEEAIKLAIRGISAASKRDVNSGNGIDIAVIDKNGFKLLEKKEIEKYI